MADDCYFCTYLENANNDPAFICEFEHSVAFVAHDQSEYAGKSILVLKTHHEHLHLIPLNLQHKITEDMTRLSTAIAEAFGAFRMNQLCLGNSQSHVHWHIVPRYPNDLNAGQPPVFKRDHPKLSEQEYRTIAARILDALKTQ